MSHLTGLALEALHRAALTITSELAVEKVLQQIVDVARTLINAQYAALGVPNADGYLETFIYSGMPKETAVHIPHLPRGLGLLGALIVEHQPLRLPTISEDARSVGFPEGHPPMASFLGVPIWAGTKVIGNLYLTNKQGANEFSEDDQRLVEMLAAYAAVAIQNARLYEEAERGAILEERIRIGMDLHDGVIQSLFAVGLSLESARLSLPDDLNGATNMVDTAIQGIDEAIKDIRNYILDLRPRRFTGDLAHGLGQLVREFQANTLVQVELDVPDKIENLPTLVAHTLFLTTQEALANVARHAKATKVVIRLRLRPTAVSLTISDNGQGFQIQDRTRHIGHGLTNMQSRAQKQSGTFSIRSQPNQGTTLSLKLPRE